jgi:hypothetical protein
MARIRTKVTRTTPTRTWAPTPSIPATVLTPEARHGRRTSPSGHRAHGLTAPCHRAPDSRPALPAGGHATRASTPARGYALRTRRPAPAALGRALRAAVRGSRARVVPVLCQIRPSPRTSSPCTPTAGPYPRAARASSTVRRRPARKPTAGGDGSQAAGRGGQAGQVPPMDRVRRVTGSPMVPAASGSGRDSPVMSTTVRGSRVRNTSVRRALGLAGSGQASQERVSTGQASPAPASREAPTSAPDSQVKGRTAQASTARVSQDRASMVPGQARTDLEEGHTGRARGSTDPAGSTSRTRAPIPTHTRRAGTGTAREPVPTVPPRTRGDAVHQVPATAPRRSGPVQDRWGPGSRAAGRAAHGSLAPPASAGKASTARDLTGRTTSALVSTAPTSTAPVSTAPTSTAPVSTAPVSTAPTSTALGSTGLGSTGRPSAGQAGQVLASMDRNPAAGSHVRVRKGLASGDLAAGRVRTGKASNQAGDSGSRAARPAGSATRRTAAPCILACAPRVRGRTRAAP